MKCEYRKFDGMYGWVSCQHFSQEGYIGGDVNLFDFDTALLIFSKCELSKT